MDLYIDFILHLSSPTPTQGLYNMCHIYLFTHKQVAPERESVSVVFITIPSVFCAGAGCTAVPLGHHYQGILTLWLMGVHSLCNGYASWDSVGFRITPKDTLTAGGRDRGQLSTS